MTTGRALTVLSGLVVLALAVAGFAGCGDDEESAITTPTTEPATPTGATGPGADGEDRPEQGRPDNTGGVGLGDGTVSPPPETEPENLPTEQEGDSPGNDIPPEPGSPAETFEKYCEANPEACN